MFFHRCFTLHRFGLHRPRVKAEVDRLADEEMRRSTKNPTDFLNDLRPLPTFNFQEYPMVGREYERVRTGRPLVALNRSRYELGTPAFSKRNEETAWKQALQIKDLNAFYNIRDLNAFRDLNIMHL